MVTRCFSFAASGSINVTGGTSRVVGVNILAAADAATVKVIGNVSAKVYAAAGAGIGLSAGSYLDPITVDEKDSSLTVTVTGTAPSVTVSVQ